MPSVAQRRQASGTGADAPSPAARRSFLSSHRPPSSARRLAVLRTAFRRRASRAAARKLPLSPSIRHRIRRRHQAIALSLARRLLGPFGLSVILDRARFRPFVVRLSDPKVRAPARSFGPGRRALFRRARLRPARLHEARCAVFAFQVTIPGACAPFGRCALRLRVRAANPCMTAAVARSLRSHRRRLSQTSGTRRHSAARLPPTASQQARRLRAIAVARPLSRHPPHRISATAHRSSSDVALSRQAVRAMTLRNDRRLPPAPPPLRRSSPPSGASSLSTERFALSRSTRPAALSPPIAVFSQASQILCPAPSRLAPLA